MRKLTTLNLAFITIASVDGIRNLPAAALMGDAIFLYFGLALCFFLLPCAIVSNWFSKQSAEGIYGWVKQSLGTHLGFIAIWLQLIQNIMVYPTFLSFIGGMFLYCVDPNLANNKYLLFLIINTLIWTLTWINIRGFHLSNKLNTFCSIFGIFLPFILILIIGCIWSLYHPHVVHLTPPAEQNNLWGSLTAIILSFCGIEMAAVHINNSEPNAFTKAIAISVIVIFVTMLVGSLTLAMFIPAQHLNLISSIPELIQLFFTQIQLDSGALPINILIMIGCIGCANSWLLSPIQGLLFAQKDYRPSSRKTDTQITGKLLLLQAGGVSMLSMLFLLFPMINTCYWLMLTLATQMYLLMYFLMFIGAIKQVLKTKTHKFIAIAACFGLLGVNIALIVSFTPPSAMMYGSQLEYDIFLGACLIFLACIPILGKKALNFAPRNTSAITPELREI
ncbi:MAG: APC family permease [Legionellaceae bacterium]|nr:APC family permease [Legionellaceae bacterium]